MIYHSVAEILAANDEMRRRLVNRLEGLNDAELNFRASDDAWSIAEIVEHLSIIEKQMCALTMKLLAHAEASVEAGAPPFDLQSNPISIQAFAEQAAREKYQAPEAVRPTGTVSVADSLAGMQGTRASLRQLQPRLEAANLSSATFPHPFFGALNLYEWLAFIGMHEARHLRQIEAVAAAPEFKTLDAARAADTGV